jgi:hypothetical protein
MAIEWDPILFVNLVLCVIIVGLGIRNYRNSQETLPLFIAGAFGLFGISHAATLLGYKILLTVPLIIIRALAYILVIYALAIHYKTSIISKETTQAWVDFFQGEARPSPPEREPEKEKK